MKIAIIGSGISGLTSAYYLYRHHDITVFESEGWIGGHTATVDVCFAGEQQSIDTGFIVFNDWTYPAFIELMDELGIESKETEMSFSVRCDTTGIEYGGNSFNSLFAQRLNFFKPSFHRMIRDILKFNRESIFDLENNNLSPSMKLGQYLEKNRYSSKFINQYLVPMGCAIWSASTDDMFDFPALFFIRFFKNHGLLSVSNRPQWRVIRGGSKSYLKPLTKGFERQIKLNSKIKSVMPSRMGVHVEHHDGSTEKFDQVVMACHSDQSHLLLDPVCFPERTLLSRIPYQSNEVVLHVDNKLLPKRKKALSSWNYWLKKQNQDKAILTYHMNTLQGFASEHDYCVTLNATESINPEKIIQQFNYSHPVFSADSIKAANDLTERNGQNGLWFAGAYMGNGFHEDGVRSGKRVADKINQLWVEDKRILQQGEVLKEVVNA
ncbi:MAG: putative NAD/FAD-binding protein [Gammaproteobacteria bacterium]|jgi:predicted NAD/FAD-binding protein